MKAHVKENMLVSRVQVRREIDKYTQETYDKIAVDISEQVLALVLLTLDKNYGWKKKRLKKLIEHMQSYADLISLGNIMGNNVDTWAIVKYVKDTYGIDLKKELSL